MCYHDDDCTPENCPVCQQEQVLLAQERDEDDARQSAARLLRGPRGR